MPKCKVGEKVECIENPNPRKTGEGDFPGTGWKKGYCFVIKRITNLGGVPCYWNEVRGGGVWEDFLRLVNPKEGKKMSDVNIREEVAAVFEQTKDAVVVEKYVGTSIGGGFVNKLILQTYKKEILEEAYRRKAEAEEEKKE